MPRKRQNLLFDEPLIILPSLAEEIGLNEAIVLQQIHLNHINEKRYNTYENWQKNNFPFWSTRKVKRIFQKLENENLISNFNVNYEKISQIEATLKEKAIAEKIKKQK